MMTTVLKVEPARFYVIVTAQFLNQLSPRRYCTQLICNFDYSNETYVTIQMIGSIHLYSSMTLK